MKDQMISTLILDAAWSRAQKKTPAGRLYDDLCGDLESWCCRQRRHKNIRHGVFATAILVTISITSATAMANQLPDCKMAVSVPFQQKALYDLTVKVTQQQ